MRDLVVSLVIVGLLPAIIMHPTTGVLVWSWLSYMNPHRLTYGFAFNFPFVQVVAILTLAAMVFSREKKRFPWCALTVTWLIWVAWLCLTTYFAINTDEATEEWSRAMKIQLMTLATLLLMGERVHIERLVWVIALSIGFFGIKGGVFTIFHGGTYMVLGPPGSFIFGNNEIALALLMVLPLLRYIQLTARNVWVKRAMLASMVLCAASILGSWSRGALVGACVMLFVLWFQTRSKWVTGTAIVVTGMVLLAFMPKEWMERMGTIETYQQDPSALGRLNAWSFAINLAGDRPLGAGFQAFSPELFARYAPDPADVHDAHSIYFEVLAEQGYGGLAIFLALGVFSVLQCRRIIHRTAGHSELRWAHELAAMLQVALTGYAVGGAFLGLAYFDLPYSLMALVALTDACVGRALAAQPGTQSATGIVGAMPR